MVRTNRNTPARKACENEGVASAMGPTEVAIPLKYVHAYFAH